MRSLGGTSLLLGIDTLNTFLVMGSILQGTCGACPYTSNNDFSFILGISNRQNFYTGISSGIFVDILMIDILEPKESFCSMRKLSN